MLVAGSPAIFVGTGGTLAVAKLAAQLHERVGGQPGRVATPMELAGMPPLTRSGVVIFSAGLKHPDALAAVERLRSSRLRPAVVITLRDPTTLGSFIPSDVRVVDLPALDFREGFLATTSVLVMMTALVRAYKSDDLLPTSIPLPLVPMPPLADQLLILTTPSLAPVATDLETRCHELGLAAVQVTDYRNFAHGRHFGLERRAADTAVIGLVDQPWERLATATLNTLSASKFSVTRWGAEHKGPASVLELLIASMEFAGTLARAQGVNAARPGVTPVGRRLYHLGIGRLLPPSEDGPVERKLLALAAGPNIRATRDVYVDALRTWKEQLQEQRFGGIVLDYDGTVCATSRRAQLPDKAIQANILRLLDAGVVVAFASGRGKSLHRDLRAWIARRHWPRVIIGLYNGGTTLTLAEPMPDLLVPSPLMRRALRRLSQLPVFEALETESRSGQITVTVRLGAEAQVGRLGELIEEVLSRSPAIPVKVVISGHSVDILPRSTTKLTVVHRVSQLTDSEILAIGDQGEVGGNDFELLAGSSWTLTVDGCSADPTRCWYLDTLGRGGPDLLLAYLEVITTDGGTFSLTWRDP